MALRSLSFSMRVRSTPIFMSTRRTLTTTPRLFIKEDANRSPEELEKAKQEQLKEQKDGQGRWREDLASHGESNIAADKEKVTDHDSHMKKLQEETSKQGEEGKI